MRLFAAATLLASVVSALPSCSVRRTLDQETMDEITAACRLTGSRIIRRNGRSAIDIHAADETDEKLACIERQMQERNITMHLNFGDLGAAKAPPEVQECTQRAIEESRPRRLDEIVNIQAECARAHEDRK